MTEEGELFSSEPDKSEPGRLKQPNRLRTGPQLNKNVSFTEIFFDDENKGQIARISGPAEEVRSGIAGGLVKSRLDSIKRLIRNRFR